MTVKTEIETVSRYCEWEPGCEILVVSSDPDDQDIVVVEFRGASARVYRKELLKAIQNTESA